MYVQQRRRECTANNSKLLHEFMSENFLRPPALPPRSSAGPTLLLLTISQLLQQLHGKRHFVRSFLVSFSCRALLLLWWCRLGIPQLVFLSSSSFELANKHSDADKVYISFLWAHRSLKYLQAACDKSPRSWGQTVLFAPCDWNCSSSGWAGGNSDSMQFHTVILQWGRMGRTIMGLLINAQLDCVHAVFSSPLSSGHPTNLWYTDLIGRCY